MHTWMTRACAHMWTNTEDASQPWVVCTKYVGPRRVTSAGSFGKSKKALWDELGEERLLEVVTLKDSAGWKVGGMATVGP